MPVKRPHDSITPIQPLTQRCSYTTGPTLGSTFPPFLLHSVGNTITRCRPVLLQAMIENAAAIFETRPCASIKAREEILGNLRARYGYVYNVPRERIELPKPCCEEQV